MDTSGRRGDEAHDTGERIRFCLGCGEAVAFDEPVCPACGLRDATVAGPRAEAPCPACRRPRLATLVYCPFCGKSSVPTPARAGATAAGPGADGAEAIAAVSVVLALLGPLLVAFAVGQAVFTRGG